MLRLALDDDFTQQPVYRREAYVDDWIDRYLTPLIPVLDPQLRHFLGMDYARHRDFSIICPMSVDQARHRDVPFVVEMHKVPTRQQQQVLFYLLRHLPHFIGAALDASGNGETLAEDTADTFGRNRIHQVKISRSWYGAWMPKFVQLFEDASLTIPRDDSLHQDIRAIEQVDGIPMIIKARSQDLKDPELYRHGDFAGAGVLAHFATLEVNAAPINVKSRRPRSGRRITQGYA
ncbi:hypothetical protein [Pseudomonas sp. SLFW]|uniref:hypothetical protein n=1 Tax=Pseudomonas sp. SLFW TaxID=2683259 RepID=UPI002113E40C|nr:hypothetical protein [Pseudomonas sp. SLFW]